MTPDEFHTTLEGLPDSSKALRWQVYARQKHAARDAELASVKAENSKLRSALEIVHFKREPWQ